MDQENDKVLAWHFLDVDKCLGYGDRRLVVVGQTLEHRAEQGPIEPARRGLHASENLIDALGLAAGPVLCRVELSGEIKRGIGKCVATRRKVLWMVEEPLANQVYQLFSVWCARSALERTRLDLPCVSQALEVAERFARWHAYIAELDRARQSIAPYMHHHDPRISNTTHSAWGATADHFLYGAVTAAYYDRQQVDRFEHRRAQQIRNEEQATRLVAMVEAARAGQLQGISTDPKAPESRP